MRTTTFMEDIEKFTGNLTNSNAEDLIVSFIVLLIIGAVMKNRNSSGGNDRRGFLKLMGF